jgi:hypothetical protein
MAGTYRGRHASRHLASTTRRGLRDRRRGRLLRWRAGRRLASLTKPHRTSGVSPALRITARPRLERSYLPFAITGLSATSPRPGWGCTPRRQAAPATSCSPRTAGSGLYASRETGATAPQLVLETAGTTASSQTPPPRLPSPRHSGRRRQPRPPRPRRARRRAPPVRRHLPERPATVPRSARSRQPRPGTAPSPPTPRWPPTRPA